MAKPRYMKRARILLIDEKDIVARGLAFQSSHQLEAGLYVQNISTELKPRLCGLTGYLSGPQCTSSQLQITRMPTEE